MAAQIDEVGVSGERRIVMRVDGSGMGSRKASMAHWRYLSTFALVR
jgi:hypothetical protein